MFGIVETIGGFLKLLLVIGVGIAMYVIHSLPPAANEPSREPCRFILQEFDF
jgi:hypothetical protein